MSRVKRLVALIVAVVALALAATASAHPLGNFTINHYSRVQPSGRGASIGRKRDL